MFRGQSGYNRGIDFESQRVVAGTLLAGPTRLELATSGVTGRRSNQLNYDPAQKLRL